MAAFNVLKAGGALLSSISDEISNLSHNVSGYESADELRDNVDPIFVAHGRRGIFVYFVIATERSGNVAKTVHLDIESRCVNVYDGGTSRSYKCSTIFSISLEQSYVTFKTKSSRSLHPKYFKFANADVSRSFVDMLLYIIEYGNTLRAAYNFMTPARQSLSLEALHHGMISTDIETSMSSLQSILDLRDGEYFDYVDFFNLLRGGHAEGLRDCLFMLLVKAGIYDDSPLMPSLLGGESVVKTVPNVLWCIVAAADDGGEGFARGGVLTVTNYRLCFSRPRYQAQRYSKDYSPPFFDLISIPLNSIRKVKVNGVASSVVQRSVLTVKLKDLRVFRVKFMQKLSCHEELVALKDDIEARCFAITTKELFCFQYRPTFDIGRTWRLSDIQFDYDRMGVLTDPEWRIMQNTGGSMVPSYPNYFAVPMSFPQDDLSGCWAFRSKGRLPALTYRHRSRQTSLARSSQPMIGHYQHYQRLDVNLLNTYRKSGVLNEIRCVGDHCLTL